MELAHKEKFVGVENGERVRIMLRVQNEQFSEEKGFILRYTEKEA